MSSREPFYITWRNELSPDNLGAGIFVYGDQAAWARRLLRETAAAVREKEQNLELRTFFLFDKNWAEILDEALVRDMFLLNTRRIFAVYFPEAEDDDPQLAEKAWRQLVSPYEDEIARYFASPPEGVSLAIVYAGRLRKGNSLLDFFTRLKNSSGGALRLLEMKTPWESELVAWVQDEIRKRGRRTSPQAIASLLEVVGSDLVLLENEIEKLALYAGEKAVIGEEEVLTVCGFQRTDDRFALEEALESGSLEEALRLHARFMAGQPDAQEVLNYFSSISRFIISLARARYEVVEKKVPVREVFRKLHPQISESWSLFDRKLSAFTSCLKSFTQKELDDLVRELGKLDLRLKSTDLDPGILIETFLIKFFQLRDKGKAGV